MIYFCWVSVFRYTLFQLYWYYEYFIFLSISRCRVQALVVQTLEGRRGSWGTPHLKPCWRPRPARRRKTGWMMTSLRITWTSSAWSSLCVLLWWGELLSWTKCWPHIIDILLESSGAVGWPCTVPASASPTPSTMTTPSRSCPASCSPSPPWSCLTSRTQHPWHFPSQDSYWV